MFFLYSLQLPVDGAEVEVAQEADAVDQRLAEGIELRPQTVSCHF